jgi:hypothetical protein
MGLWRKTMYRCRDVWEKKTYRYRDVWEKDVQVPTRRIPVWCCDGQIKKMAWNVWWKYLTHENLLFASEQCLATCTEESGSPCGYCFVHILPGTILQWNLRITTLQNEGILWNKDTSSSPKLLFSVQIALWNDTSELGTVLVHPKGVFISQVSLYTIWFSIHLTYRQVSIQFIWR